MKKLLRIALALTLALSLSVTAFAAGDDDPGTGGTTSNDTTINEKSDPKTGDTTVEFSVAPAYTITIPALVELSCQKADDGTVTYEQDTKITASPGVRLLNGQEIQVTLSAKGNENRFVLTSKESAELPYTVTVENREIESGDTVATFGTSLTGQTETLCFTAADPKYAGEYSGTVTFTISVVTPNTTNP